MLKVKIRTLSVLVVVLLGLIVAACGNASSTPPLTGSPEETGSPKMSQTPAASEDQSAGSPRDEVRVEVDGSGDYATLEEAVAAAAPRATITLGPGMYRLLRGLEIDTSLTLVGAGMDETEIVSGAPGHVVRFTGSGSFNAEGITFRHDGKQMADVVVIEEGTGRFSGCRFTGAIYEEGKGNRAGLRFRGRSRGTVENSVASGNDNTGFLVEQQAQPELRGNICSDNGLVGIGYMDLAKGLVSENECTGNVIGIALAVESGPTLERNKSNDNDYGIAYLDNAGGESYGNEVMRNKVGITIGGSSTVQLGDNDVRDNTEEDIRDSR
jgi:parallel beta-helix repeat protein